MAKSKYNRKAEHLQHIVKQQRARLEQASIELKGTEKEVSQILLGFSVTVSFVTTPTFEQHSSEKSFLACVTYHFGLTRHVQAIATSCSAAYS